MHAGSPSGSVPPSGAGTLEPALVRDLERVVGSGGVLTGTGRLLPYESDALTRFRQLPRAVILPRDTDQTARVVRMLVEAGVPLTPRGAGTGLSGGGVAAPGGVLLCTARMNRILDLDASRRLARVQAGVINSDLSRAAAPFGLHYAPDPSSQAACTLGGNVAENAGGPHCLKYGVTTRYVTGLTVVTGVGEVLELGGAGGCETLDLVGLFVGSEGRFGLATEIELRLVPRPSSVRTLLAAFESTEAAGAAVSEIIASGLLPAAMEIMDRGSIEAVEASVYAAGYPTDAGAVLVVEFDGTEAGLDAEAEAAEFHCREAGATQLRRARSEAERQALWQGRKKAYGAFGRIAPDLMVQDATVPRSALPEVLSRIGEIGRRHGLRVANVFHAGDGNLHPKLLFDRRIPELVERVGRASREMMQVCVDAGGTITGEHGVGLDKRDYMHLVHGPGELAAMRAVQRVFDPAGVWNPGKVLPEAGPEGFPDPVPASPLGSGSTGEGGADGEFDGVSGGGAPGAGSVVRPSSVEEVQALLSRASRQGIPLRIRARGAPEVEEGVTLLTGGLPAEVHHAPADLTVTVGAGCTLGALQDVLARSGQWLPVDLPGADGWTVGEVVARGESGLLAPAFGRVRDLLLGAELVAGDGQRLRLGGRVMKNVAGFDLVRGAVGSRGRWGVLTALTFRLLPLPRAQAVLTWEGASAETGEWVRRLATHRVLPASLVRALEEGGSRVWLRLLGSGATVQAEVRELRSVASGAQVWSGEPVGAAFLAADPLSRAWMPDRAPGLDGGGPGGEVRGWEDGDDPATVLEIRPGGWAAEALVEEVRRLFPTRTLWHLPLEDRWQLLIPREAGPKPEAAWRALAESLASQSGRLCVLRGGGPASRPRANGPVARLEDGVCAVFDPAGVLRPATGFPERG